MDARYCQLNFACILACQDLYQEKHPPPFTPGELVTDLSRVSNERKYYILLKLRAEEQPWRMKAAAGRAEVHLRHLLRASKTTAF